MNKYLTLILLLFPLSSYGGWFGPSSYDECMLEMMKGQNIIMHDNADKVCESKFPYEKKLYSYKKQIDISFWSTTNSLNLKINKNNGEYRITKYKASFSKKECNKIKKRNDYTLTKTFTFSQFSNKSNIKLHNKTNQYICMKTIDIFGIRK